MNLGVDTLLLRKHLKNYVLTSVTDEKGRVRKELVYTGSYYQWRLYETELREKRLFLLISCIVSWGLYLLPLLMYSVLTRLVYVILPYSLFAFSIFYVSTSIFNLWTAQNPFTFEKKNKSIDRMKPALVVGVMLLVLSLIGQVVGIVIWKEYINYSDVILTVSTILLIPLFLFDLKESKYLLTNELENPLS